MDDNKAISISGDYIPTDTDISIVRYLAEDLRPSQIAEKRGSAKKTVEAQIAAIKRKTGKKTIGGVVIFFVRNGLIE